MMRRVLHPMLTLVLAAGCGSADSAREGDASEAEAEAPLPAGWQRSEVAGLRIAAPGEFGVRTMELPDEVEAKLKRFDNYSVEGDSVHVNVTRATYRPGEEITALESAEGAVGAMSEDPRMEGLSRSHARMEVSGRLAVRSRWRGVYDGQPLSGEILTFVDGPVLWQIKVTGTAPEQTTATAARVMASVRIAR